MWGIKYGAQVLAALTGPDPLSALKLPMDAATHQALVAKFNDTLAPFDCELDKEVTHVTGRT